MWKRKDDSGTASEEAGSRSGLGMSRGIQRNPEEYLGAPAPARPAHQARSTIQRRTGSRLGATVQFKGDIRAEEDLTIQGTVEGKIMVPGHTLTLEKGSHLRAEVKVLHLIVHGYLNGKVVAADKVVLKKTGRFEGDLTTRRLAIEDGAVFIGHSAVHVDTPDRRPALKPEVAPKRARGRQAAPEKTAAGPPPRKAGPKPAL